MIFTFIGAILLIGIIFLVAAVLEPPKAKLWVAVLLLYIIELVRLLPLGK